VRSSVALVALFEPQDLLDITRPLHHGNPVVIGADGAAPPPRPMQERPARCRVLPLIAQSGSTDFSDALLKRFVLAA
jgi:hypothetical protein